jgi:alanyl-tRNA synthetase
MQRLVSHIHNLIKCTNHQILAAASAIGKTLSKAIYVFSPDEETGKVAHLNYVPKEILSSKKLDAKIWLGEVSKVIGGKVSHVFVR